MSGNQEDPELSVQSVSVSFPPGVSSLNAGVESIIQDAPEAHIPSTPTPVKSSSSSQGSNFVSADSSPQKSCSSLSIKGKWSLRENASSHDKNKPRRSYGGPGGRRPDYDGSTDMPSTGQFNERRQSRVSFNLNGSRSHNRSPSGGGRNSRYDDYEDDDNDDNVDDDYDDDSEENPFEDKAVRRAFIRKVYLLIMCMMLFTTALIGVVMFHIPTRIFVLTTWWLVVLAWALYPIVVLALIYVEYLRRTVPINYFMLALLTLSLGFLAAFIAANYQTFEVLAAFGITAAVCLGLTLFACQTRWDFTVISGGLVVASIVMMAFGILCMIWRNKILRIVYCCLGVLVSCLFFVFDTQMIIGGNHKYALNPEEYVLGAICLFIDMINIFILTLNLIGLARH